MQTLSQCPVCKQANFSVFLQCKDHTVSNQTFRLQRCESCGFVITNPRPEPQDLSTYYQSDAYISHSDKSTGLLDKVYKIFRAYTMRWKYQLIKRHSLITPISVLDFGCGTGAFLGECLKHNMHVTGIEPSATARQQAERNTKAEIKSGLEDIQRSFDVITLWHVLEHVNDLNETLEKLKSKLAENGTMFIAVPNLNSNDAKEYREHWAAYDVPRHLWHFSRGTMQMLLHHHDLNLSEVLPMRLDAYYVSLLSEKYKRGKSTLLNMASAVINGMKSNQRAQTTQEYSSLIYIVRK